MSSRRGGARRRCNRFCAIRKADVVRLRSFWPLANLELDACAIRQRTKSAAADGGKVHKQVLRAVVGLDEAETLLGVEPFNAARRHGGLVRGMQLLTAEGVPQ